MAAATNSPPDQHPALKKRRSSMEEPPILRMIIFGSSGHQQFSLTNSILQKKIFNNADSHTILTTKNTETLFGKNVTLVNTPNLKDHDIFGYMSKKEVKKAVCFCCPGPHAVLFTLNPLDMPQDIYNIFKPVVQYFGEQIFNNTILVLYHDEEQWSQCLEESVRKNKQFRELLERCSQRCLVFSSKENKGNGNETRALFEQIYEVVEKHGIFSNVEFKDADKRIMKEEKIIQNQRKKEDSAKLEEMMNSHSQEEVTRYEEQIKLEIRDEAELQVAERLGFALRLVDYTAAIGKGAFAGAVLSVALGFPGMAVGAVVGAALGGLLGGAAGAAWNMISNALTSFRTERT